MSKRASRKSCKSRNKSRKSRKRLKHKTRDEPAAATAPAAGSRSGGGAPTDGGVEEHVEVRRRPTRAFWVVLCVYVVVWVGCLISLGMDASRLDSLGWVLVTYLLHVSATFALSVTISVQRRWGPVRWLAILVLAGLFALLPWLVSIIDHVGDSHEVLLPTHEYLAIGLMVSLLGFLAGLILPHRAKLKDIKRP